MSLTSPSFLQSVLANAVEGELTDLNVKVKSLEKSIEFLQIEVEGDIIARYKEYDDVEVSHDGISDNLFSAKKLLEELEDAAARIKAKVDCDLDTSTRDLQLLHESLQKARSVLLPLHHLLLVDNSVQLIARAHSQQKFVEAAEQYSVVKSLLNKSSNDSEPHKLLGLLEKEFHFTGVKLKSWLNMVWRKCVSWHEADSSPNSRSTVLNISKSQLLGTNEAIKALYYVGCLDSLLLMFGNTLMKDVLLPITRSVTTVQTKKFEDHVQLYVKTVSGNVEPHPSIVAKNIIEVFDFLEAEVDTTVGPESTCINILGKHISKNLVAEFSKVMSKSLIENNQSFDECMELIPKFLWALNVIGLIPSELAQEYIVNLQNKFGAPSWYSRSKILEKARDIMKGDLRDMVLIQENSSNSVNGLKQNGYSEHDEDKSERGRAVCSSYVFPSCHVSKWIVKLVEFIRILCNESVNKDEAWFHTARGVIYLYLTAAPVLHRESIESLHLEVALFYNNCMFLVHHLILLGFEQQPQIHPDAPRPELTVDLIQQLRKLATGSLFKYFEKERAAMIEATKSVDVAQLDENSAGLEDQVKYCLDRVEQLHCVWKNVLSVEMSSKLIGGLLNSWLEELIALVLCADHIPDSIAQHLIVVYETIAGRIRKLFKVPADISTHVSRWNRFNALIDILGSTLNEIEIKWTSGAFSRDMRAEHMKTFIFSRFKDSQARSDVLSNIK